MKESSKTAGRIYDVVSGDGGERICKGISEGACQVVPGNFLKQLAAMVATKTGDAFSKPGLVLAWLLTALGAPGSAVGLLAPVREAGSMLPQLLVGGVLGRRAIRKWFWVVGSVVQGAAVGGMALAGWRLEGATAGWVIVGLLALFSLARGVCSISSKDLLGKTIPKTRRGRLGGLASSVSGVVAVAVGVFFAMRGQGEVPVVLLVCLLAIASGLWLTGALVMGWVVELPSEVEEGDGSAVRDGLGSLALLRDDAVFRRFCIARGLLASTVLSMPFYVVLAHSATGGKIGSLGILMVAGSLATALSGAVWGRFADRSSRVTLAVAGVSAGVIGVVAAVVAGFEVSEAVAIWVYGGLFFLIGLAHTGIRLGRKTYLVDMATEKTRASYVAVSNTLIGVVLLVSGGFGLLVNVVGERGVILVFALLGIAGGAMAFRLPEAGER